MSILSPPSVSLGSAQEDVFRLGSLFSSGMVLQRSEGGLHPHLWGRGRPGTQVSATITEYSDTGSSESETFNMGEIM